MPYPSTAPKTTPNRNTATVIGCSGRASARPDNRGSLRRESRWPRRPYRLQDSPILRTLTRRPARSAAKGVGIGVPMVSWRCISATFFALRLVTLAGLAAQHVDDVLDRLARANESRCRRHHRVRSHRGDVVAA